MGRNVYVNQDLWDDEDFEGMSHEAQRSWFRLKFDRRLGIAGLGRFSKKAILAAIGLPTEQAEEVFLELQRKWFRFDERTSLLWLRDAFRHDPNRSPNTLKAVATEIRRSPRSAMLLQWWDIYKGAFEGCPAVKLDMLGFMKELRRGFEGASEGPGSGFEGASKPPSRANSASASASVSGPALPRPESSAGRDHPRDPTDDGGSPAGDGPSPGSNGEDPETAERRELTRAAFDVLRTAGGRPPEPLREHGTTAELEQAARAIAPPSPEPDAPADSPAADDFGELGGPSR